MKTSLSLCLDKCMGMRRKLLGYQTYNIPKHSTKHGTQRFAWVSGVLGSFCMLSFAFCPLFSGRKVGYVTYSVCSYFE